MALRVYYDQRMAMSGKKTQTSSVSSQEGFWARWTQRLNANPSLELTGIALLGSNFILIHIFYLHSLYYDLSFKAVLERDAAFIQNPLLFIPTMASLTALLFVGFRKLQQPFPRFVRLTFYGLLLYFGLGFLLLAAFSLISAA